MVLEAPLIAADIVQWLYSDAVGRDDSLALIEELAQRLCAGGIPVDRITTGIMILHPNVRAEASVWTSDGTRELRRYLANEELDESYENSPFKVVHTENKLVHLPITAEFQPGEFSIFAELRAEGYIDYVALPMPFSDGSIKAFSVATKDPGGFSVSSIAVLESIIRPLGLVCELATLRRTAETLLDTYVGPRAGRRVLDGKVKRGDGEWISAIVSFADLRGFTRLSNTLPADKLVHFLNKYFGAMAAAVEAHGGEVLKFIGDEVMAIFPYDTPDEASDAARRALKAAGETTENIRSINQDNSCDETPDMSVGIALHAGDVFFGNVGSETRLDFTVIGPAVNLAARIAELAKDLNVEVLVSDKIAEIMGCRGGLYGQYQVKGFDEPVSVYSPSLVGGEAGKWCPDNTAVRDLDAN
ncbi:adenylate/guanylate cyclase domain-containing protein [Roseibium algae]|uniref:Adenylate/guanylate cyclase domain-containing protein n=1 Tax=Roseibium algae TaxID=3123038 RepID=A0ABU8TSD7_9HYPH